MQNEAVERPERQPTAIGPLVRRPRPRLPPLPTPLTSLVGRSAEITRVRALLADPARRLVTLIGPGGVGKTRLALAVASAERAAGADIAVVTLAAIVEPAQVAAAIAALLEVRIAADQPPVEALRAAIETWPLRLVLDNVEQVLSAADLLVDLLGVCPNLSLLVTSRERLHVSGEHVVPVPPLSLPGREVEKSRSREVSDQPLLASSEAVQLFVARAQAANPAFELKPEHAVAVAEVCRRLDGLPLAIELAAARSNVLPPAALLARVERRLPLLSGGPRDQPARLRTMRAAIGWSYDLLTPAEQTLFRRLAIFASGFTLEAAEDVSRGDGLLLDSSTPRLLDSVTALVDKSLLQPEPSVAGEPRFRMLETLREYALDELAAQTELPDVRRAHAAYYLSVAERAESGLTSPQHVEWLDRLEAEHDNLRAALGWAVEEADPGMVLRFGAALWWFWAIRGHWAEGRDWLERGLALRGGSGPLLAPASYGLGSLALVQGDLDRAEAFAAEAYAAFLAVDDILAAGQALLLLGRAVQRSGRAAAARERFLEAERHFVALGDERWIASALHNQGLVAYQEGDYPEARAVLTDALRRWHALGYTWGLATCIPGHLADIARAEGEVARAAALYRESLVLNREQRDRSEIAGLLVGVSLLTLGQDATGAAWLLGTAAAVRQTLDTHVTPREQADADEGAAATQAVLGSTGFAAAVAAGGLLPLAEAMSKAETLLARLDADPDRDPDPGRRPAVAGGRFPDAGLSPREIEVLRLVVEGLTDKEIADRLQISRRTVSKHVATILGKLSVASRTAAATQASRRGIL